MLNKDNVADDLQNAILGQGGLAMDAGFQHGCRVLGSQ